MGLKWKTLGRELWGVGHLPTEKTFSKGSFTCGQVLSPGQIQAKISIYCARVFHFPLPFNCISDLSARQSICLSEFIFISYFYWPSKYASESIWQLTFVCLYGISFVFLLTTFFFFLKFFDCHRQCVCFFTEVPYT